MTWELTSFWWMEICPLPVGHLLEKSLWYLIIAFHLITCLVSPFRDVWRIASPYYNHLQPPLEAIPHTHPHPLFIHHWNLVAAKWSPSELVPQEDMKRELELMAATGLPSSSDWKVLIKTTMGFSLQQLWSVKKFKEDSFFDGGPPFQWGFPWN